MKPEDRYADLRHELSSPAQTHRVVGSNPTLVMDVCACLFHVCVVVCVGGGLSTGSSPVQGVLQTLDRSRKLKSGQGST
jgi:hypothetical protein